MCGCRKPGCGGSYCILYIPYHIHECVEGWFGICIPPISFLVFSFFVLSYLFFSVYTILCNKFFTQSILEPVYKPLSYLGISFKACMCACMHVCVCVCVVGVGGILMAFSSCFAFLSMTSLSQEGLSSPTKNNEKH